MDNVNSNKKIFIIANNPKTDLSKISYSKNDIFIFMNFFCRLGNLKGHPKIDYFFMRSAMNKLSGIKTVPKMLEKIIHNQTKLIIISSKRSAWSHKRHAELIDKCITKNNLKYETIYENDYPVPPSHRSKQPTAKTGFIIAKWALKKFPEDKIICVGFSLPYNPKKHRTIKLKKRKKLAPRKKWGGHNHKYENEELKKLIDNNIIELIP